MRVFFCKVGLVLILLVASSGPLHGQSFTRITDPNHPVIQPAQSSGGGAWIDVNNDGFLDLYVPSGNVSSQPNGLFLNDTGGGFTAVRTGAVVEDRGPSIGSTWADVNDDGNLDLFVTNRNNFGNFFYLGNGDSTFTKVDAGPLVADRGDSNSSSWVDIDRDGDLDLFVINFAGNDFLYLNSGAPDFSFAANTTAPILMDTRPSISGTWADYDDDRDLDLFVGNAGSQNDFLYANTGDLTSTRTTIRDGRSTLGASWGDYDNDGDLDLFVANFLDQNNILYNNTGSPDYQLTPVGNSTVSNDGGRSVGTAWGDYDNDGDLDLFVANHTQSNALYENTGPPDYTFTKVTSSPVVSDAGSSFGAVWGDYDNDGDLDLFVANEANENNFLYRNEADGNNWIILTTAGTTSNRTGLGARVAVKAEIAGEARWQFREVQAQSGYNSQNLRLHFGLGDAPVIDSLRVFWPSGTVEVQTQVATNQILTLEEPPDPISVETEPVAGFSLVQNYPNPFRHATTIRFTLPHPEPVTLSLYDVQGRRVRVLMDGLQGAGVHTVNWTGTNQHGRALPAGIYLLKLQSNTHQATKLLSRIR